MTVFSSLQQEGASDAYMRLMRKIATTGKRLAIVLSEADHDAITGAMVEKANAEVCGVEVDVFVGEWSDHYQSTRIREYFCLDRDWRGISELEHGTPYALIDSHQWVGDSRLGRDLSWPPCLVVDHHSVLDSANFPADAFVYMTDGRAAAVTMVLELMRVVNAQAGIRVKLSSDIWAACALAIFEDSHYLDRASLMDIRMYSRGRLKGDIDLYRALRAPEKQVGYNEFYQSLLKNMFWRGDALIAYTESKVRVGGFIPDAARQLEGSRNPESGKKAELVIVLAPINTVSGECIVRFSSRALDPDFPLLDMMQRLCGGGAKRHEGGGRRRIINAGPDTFGELVAVVAKDVRTTLSELQAVPGPG